MSPIRIVRWASFDEAEDLPHPFAADDEGRNSVLPEAYRDALRSSGRRISGCDHQYLDDGVPIFSDGTAIADGWRGWGRLMAETWSEVDGVAYSYMDFYADVPPTLESPKVEFRWKELTIFWEGRRGFAFPGAWGAKPVITLVPDETTWDSAVPEWLRGRRAEVVALVEAGTNHVVHSEDASHWGDPRDREVARFGPVAESQDP